MVHQPSAGFQGQATDIEIHANEVLSLKKRLNEIYSKHTGKSVDEIKTALERDNFMTADTAKSFGLIGLIFRVEIFKVGICKILCPFEKSFSIKFSESINGLVINIFMIFS